MANFKPDPDLAALIREGRAQQRARPRLDDPFDAGGLFDDPPPPDANDAPHTNGATREPKYTPGIAWPSLKGEPPPRVWWIQDWLGPSPTLVAGAGGAGKTRLWQTLATALATGREYLAPQVQPLKVLMWLCEETRDEVWRQQAAINTHFGLSMDELENLTIVPRQGLDNTIMHLAFGQPLFTALLTELAEQVQDLAADVLVLDNLAQVFGGNANDVHQATYFVNAIAGLVRDRPFCPVLLGHVARSAGSEFSGSAAWENAVRMRWYLGSTLPDQKPADEDEETDPDIVFLARRKANYAPKDWRKLRYLNGVLIPEEAAPGMRFDAAKRNEVAELVLLAALPKLKAAGLFPTDGKTTGDYLPAQMIAKRYAQGHSKKELTDAMNRLMGAGRLRREIVGKYSNRMPRYGLVIV